MLHVGGFYILEQICFSECLPYDAVHYSGDKRKRGVLSIVFPIFVSDTLWGCSLSDKLVYPDGMSCDQLTAPAHCHWMVKQYSTAHCSLFSPILCQNVHIDSFMISFTFSRHQWLTFTEPGIKKNYLGKSFKIALKERLLRWLFLALSNILKHNVSCDMIVFFIVLSGVRN